MYIQFYGLSERPFSNVPDTTFLFKSRQYLDAYNQLLYGVHAKQGFMALVGDVGTGKTTLLNALFSFIPEKDHVVGVKHGAVDAVVQLSNCRAIPRIPVLKNVLAVLLGDNGMVPGDDGQIDFDAGFR